MAGAIQKSGGCVVGSYKDPLGGHAVIVSILPIDTVEPTPFQRDLSDAHHKRLADVITKATIADALAIALSRVNLAIVPATGRA